MPCSGRAIGPKRASSRSSVFAWRALPLCTTGPPPPRHAVALIPIVQSLPKMRKGLPLVQGAPRRGALGRAAWAALLPFLLAALLGSLFFRATSSRREAVVQRQRSVLEEHGRQDAAAALRQEGSGAALAAAAGSSSGDGVLAASGGGSGTAPSAGELPKLFLFIGILSGRGYRHRRLAVREAWANKAQIPGQVVAKFILSEDERTPQVGPPAAARCAALWVLTQHCIPALQHWLASSLVGRPA